MKFSRHLPATLPALALAALTFALFAPALRYHFVDLDDLAYISGNALVLDGFTWKSIAAAFSGHQANATMYMPLLWMSYMLDVTWLGAGPASPGGFHFTNVLLHAANAALVFLLLNLLCKKPWRAFFFAALWALHPLRVESVAWVAERKDVLSGFFALLCIAAHLRTGRAPEPRRGPGRSAPLWTGVALACFLAGLLVKPALAPLPLVLLLLDFWPLRRFESTGLSARQLAARGVRSKLPFFVLAALAAFGTVYTHRVVSGELPSPVSMRLLHVPLTYGFYLWKTIWPRHLTVLYPPFAQGASLRELAMLALLSLGALAALSAGAWRARRRRPNQGVGWLWFIAMLLPVCGLVPIPNNLVADRFTYLPSIGLSLALLRIFPTSPVPARRRWLRPLRAAGAAALLAVLAQLSLRTLPVWRNTDSLFAHVARHVPNHLFVLRHQADQAIQERGDFLAAEALVDRALRRDPRHFYPVSQKALCLSETQGPAAAKEFLATRRPEHAFGEWEWHMAIYALALGEYDEASAFAERALREMPANDVARNNVHLLAMAAAFEKGDRARALAHARQCPPYRHKTRLERLDLMPVYIALWMSSHRRMTVDFFRRLTAEYPDRLEVLNNVAWALATAAWSPAAPEEVLDYAQRARALAPPDHPGVLDTLAAAQANAGDFATASQTAQTALDALAAAPSEPADRSRPIQARLRLYQRGEPYREDAFKGRW